MLDEETYAHAYSLYGEGMKNRSGHNRLLRFKPLLDYYNQLTGWDETEPNAIMHHRISQYGPPCENCGKLYRTPKASFCAACGHKRDPNEVMKANFPGCTFPKSIGFWRSGYQPYLPDPQDFTDWSKPAEERARLVAYLDKGVKYFQYLGHSYCRFKCGIPDGQMGTADMTDGVYVWPEGLSHYIEQHGVWLPQEFIDHSILNTKTDYGSLDLRKLGFGDDTWWRNFNSLTD